MPNGDQGFGFGDIEGAIGSAIQSLAGIILQTLSAAVGFLLDITAFIWQVLLAVVHFLSKAFPALRQFLSAFWTKCLKRIIGCLWDVYKRTKEFLTRIFGPILCAIKAIIDYEERLFNIYLRPILNIISRFRQLLVVFRILHFKFAARLDRRLAELQSRIGSLGLATLRELNQIRSYLQLLMDPFGLFNPATLLASVVRTVGDLWAVLKSVGQRPLFASELEDQKRNRTVFKRDGLGKDETRAYFDKLAARVGVELRDITR